MLLQTRVFRSSPDYKNRNSFVLLHDWLALHDNVLVCTAGFFALERFADFYFRPYKKKEGGANPCQVSLLANQKKTTVWTWKRITNVILPDI